MQEDISDLLDKLNANIKHSTKVTAELSKNVKNLGTKMAKEKKGGGGGILGKLGGGAMGIATKLVDMMFKFPSQLKQIEEVGAKFSKSFEESVGSSKRLSESIKGGVDVYDMFVFQLANTRRGLDSNNAQLQDLAAITKATGESYTQIVAGLQESTAGIGGMSGNVISLNRTMELTSRAFNRSREELVQAINKLTQSTLNLLAMGGTQTTALQESMMVMKGFLPDEKLFAGFQGAIQQLLAPAGLTRSIILGFDSSKIITGQATTQQQLKMFLDLGEQGLKWSKMVARGGDAAQASLGAIMSVTGDLGNVMRARDRFLQMAEKRGIQVQGRSTEEIVSATMKHMETQAKANEEFTNTISIIQNEIMRPLKNSMADVGLSLKKLLGGNANWIRSLVGMLGRVMVSIMEGITNIALWFTAWGDLQDQLEETQKELKIIRVAFSEESLKSARDRKETNRLLDPDRTTRGMTDAFKQANMFAVRQTDALLGDIYTAIIKNTKVQQALSKRGVNVTVAGAGGSPPVSVPVRGR